MKQFREQQLKVDANLSNRPALRSTLYHRLGMVGVSLGFRRFNVVTQSFGNRNEAGLIPVKQTASLNGPQAYTKKLKKENLEHLLFQCYSGPTPAQHLQYPLPNSNLSASKKIIMKKKHLWRCFCIAVGVDKVFCYKISLFLILIFFFK